MYNILVSDPNDDGPIDARDEDGKIIISYYTLRSLLPPQLKQMSAHYNIMCGCECCIYAKSIHSSLLSWRDRYLKKLKDKSQNSQSRRSGEKSHHIYETYKNTGIPHGRHIYTKSSDMENDTMCTCPQSDHAFPHWKYVLRCCYDCLYINLPDQKTNKSMKKKQPQLCFTFITSLDVVLPMIESH